MISEKLAKALNDQVNAEYYSAYLYFSMSAYAERLGFKGVAQWLFVQAKEEMAHGTHMFQYIIDRGAAPTFAAIAQVPESFASIDDVFNKVLEHEKKVTANINNIANMAMDERDHACYEFILWYADEQVEEEANAEEIIGKLKMFEGNKALLLANEGIFTSREYKNPFPGDAKLSG